MLTLNLGFVYRHLAAGPPVQGLYANYDLLGELGKGSFATVMKALSRESGKFYAVKIIQQNKLRAAATHAPGDLANAANDSRNNASQAFAREIAILEKLTHENICQLKEVFFEESTISMFPLPFYFPLVFGN